MFRIACFRVGRVAKRSSPGGSVPDPRGAAALRFVCELIAWVAAPWALAPVSVPLAVLSVVVLIGLPTVFGTPGDKARTIVAVPGWATIALVVLQLLVAAVAPWFAWPVPVAVVATVLAGAAAVAELPRWRALARR
nr:hypothetical protein [Actinomadura rayongensis]